MLVTPSRLCLYPHFLIFSSSSGTSISFPSFPSSHIRPHPAQPSSLKPERRVQWTDSSTGEIAQYVRAKPWEPLPETINLSDTRTCVRVYIYALTHTLDLESVLLACYLRLPVNCRSLKQPFGDRSRHRRRNIRSTPSRFMATGVSSRRYMRLRDVARRRGDSVGAVGYCHATVVYGQPDLFN